MLSSERWSRLPSSNWSKLAASQGRLAEVAIGNFVAKSQKPSEESEDERGGEERGAKDEQRC